MQNQEEGKKNFTALFFYIGIYVYMDKLVQKEAHTPSVSHIYQSHSPYCLWQSITP